MAAMRGDCRTHVVCSLLACSAIFALLLVGAPIELRAQACTPVITNISCPAAGGCPTILSAAPGAVIAGTRQQRLTITGSNFRPGAQVIITMPNLDPAPLAPDVIVTQTRVVNSRLIVAAVNVNRLSSGVRNIDVLNTDCTNSGNSNLNVPGPAPTSVTTQQMFINPADSLGGPLNVQNLIVTYPRDGTIVAQGDDLYAEAVVAGGGTGLVTGVWLWDGNVSEQFSVNLIGGTSTTIRTLHPLPAYYLGPHTLQLQVTSPQTMLSAPLQVIVTGGNWSLLRLLQPGSGAGFTDAGPPALRWTPIPGASKYEVGFSAEPYFNKVDEWYTVSDNVWKVPQKIWSHLPEGELYWTVRPVDISGEIRNPAPMRSIWRVSQNLLSPPTTRPELTSSGSILLEWSGLSSRAFYRVTLTRDAAGDHVVRRYLTGSPRADLYAVRNVLHPDETFYWQVEALSLNGRVIMISPRQSFVVPAGAVQASRPAASPMLLASLHVPAIAADLVQPKINKHTPATGESVSSDQPSIKIEFSDAPDMGKLAMSVDDTDVTALATVAASVIAYAPVFPLDNGEHKVDVAVAPDSENWKFNVAAKPAPQPVVAVTTQPTNDAEVPAKKQEAPGVASRVGPEFKTHFGVDPQLGSSPAPNQITASGGQQMNFQQGHWRAELNGTEALETILSSPTGVFGHVQDYIANVGFHGQAWGLGTRFGLIAPTMYTDSQYITPATARQAVEPTITTPAGNLSFYANTNDINLGGGDASAFHDIIRGAGYEAPLPKQWASARLMWMSSRSTGIPMTTAFDANGVPLNAFDYTANSSSGDAYGGLVKLHLPSKFELVSEYAVSYSDPNLAPGPVLSADPNFQLASNVFGPVACHFDPQVTTGNPGSAPQSCGPAQGGRSYFGRAWRTVLSRKWSKTSSAMVTYRDVSPGFFTPVNPSLTPGSNPDRRGLDASLIQGTPVGSLELAYQYLQSAVNVPDSPSTLLHNFTGGWRKGFKSKTQLAVRAHEVRTSNGDLPSSLQGIDRSTLALEGLLVDQRDVGFNSSVLQQVGSLSLTATASRDWFRNRLISDICAAPNPFSPGTVVPCQNSIVTGTQFGARWRSQSFFQLQSTVSANWSVRDKMTDGGMRILSVYLMPMFMSQHTGLSLTPLASVTQTNGTMGTGITTADVLTSQFGGRIGWRLPAALRRATFSVEGFRVQMRDSLAPVVPGFLGPNFVDKRLALLLSFSQDQTQGRL